MPFTLFRFLLLLLILLLLLNLNHSRALPSYTVLISGFQDYGARLCNFLAEVVLLRNAVPAWKEAALTHSISCYEPHTWHSEFYQQINIFNSSHFSLICHT